MITTGKGLWQIPRLLNLSIPNLIAKTLMPYKFSRTEIAQDLTN